MTRAIPARSSREGSCELHLRSIDELSETLDRFLVYGETTTSLVNATPIARRDPPVPDG
jgi:Lrp/AsnC family leucine-responsive transcriptional regulator